MSNFWLILYIDKAILSHSIQTGVDLNRQVLSKENGTGWGTFREKIVWDSHPKKFPPKMATFQFTIIESPQPSSYRLSSYHPPSNHPSNLWISFSSRCLEEASQPCAQQMQRDEPKVEPSQQCRKFGTGQWIDSEMEIPPSPSEIWFSFILQMRQMELDWI